MINKTSSILLVVKLDKQRLVYSVPTNKPHLDIYKQAINNNEFRDEDVDKIFFFPETDYTTEQILYYYDDVTEKFDLAKLETDNAIDKFRKDRGNLFKILDMEFMRSLEDDCPECKDHIVRIKKHMRNMPGFLKDYLNDFTVEEIKDFDCFNNVYDINVVNGGSGYENAPTVNIEPPNGLFEGIQMEAQAIINDGKVTKIEVTQIGSGYVTSPAIKVSKSPNGNTAIAIASKPENDIIKIT
tara:strand:- start:474 stop:1196 length:723 start_codon:yes stop_codon:yes gene_type:complete